MSRPWVAGLAGAVTGCRRCFLIGAGHRGAGRGQGGAPWWTNDLDAGPFARDDGAARKRGGLPGGQVIGCAASGGFLVCGSASGGLPGWCRAPSLIWVRGAFCLAPAT